MDDANMNAEAGPTPLLDRICKPSDLKSFTTDEMKRLADEIRRKIIVTAASNGGHLAPHLGVVELAIAIHHVFDTEHDVLIWDVGHQCYPHKLLTGRSAQFHTVRMKDGLSGYPKPSESPYDPFIVGHSSTSISAALGMAIARDRLGGSFRCISVIGDGAMTAGMAFEALAHAGHLNTDMLVILNDNRMSISPSVGALSAYFSRLITARQYTRAREDLSGLMKQIVGPQITRAAQRVEQSVKGLITPCTMFEELGFKYVGPVDGHDIDTLIDCFSNIKTLKGPVFFHCVTQKGKGYEFAEEDPVAYHGVKAFNIRTGLCGDDASSGPCTFTDAFSEAMLEAACKDTRVVGITAAMSTGTGLNRLEKQLPGRVFDVGICEQHAVTLAAGLAAKGMKPVCAIYSTFLQRGFDQCLHDVCIQGLPVVFAIDRAGAVGEDSPTQQGAYDLSFLRIIPGLTILAPRDAYDLKHMLYWALTQTGPVAIRYARAAAPQIGQTTTRDISRAEWLKRGKDATILGLGPCLASCLKAAEALQLEGVSVGVADARWVKPLDTALLNEILTIPLITIEENTLEGGFGSSVLEYYQKNDQLRRLKMTCLGFPDLHMAHATRNQQLDEAGLNPEGILRAVKTLLSKN